MVPGTGSDKHVCRRTGHPSGTGAPGQFIGRLPYVRSDFQFGQCFFVTAEDGLLMVASGSNPELQPHWRTPARVTTEQERIDPASHRRITPRAQLLDPRGSVDERHFE